MTIILWKIYYIFILMVIYLIIIIYMGGCKSKIKKSQAKTAENDEKPAE